MSAIAPKQFIEGSTEEILYHSAHAGDVEGVNKALADGADPNSVDCRGCQPIYLAVMCQHVGEQYESIVAILAPLTRPDQADIDSCTPAALALHTLYATYESPGQEDLRRRADSIVECLKSNGANMDSAAIIVGRAAPGRTDPSLH